MLKENINALEKFPELVIYANKLKELDMQNNLGVSSDLNHAKNIRGKKYMVNRHLDDYLKNEFVVCHKMNIDDFGSELSIRLPFLETPTTIKATFKYDVGSLRFIEISSDNSTDYTDYLSGYISKSDGSKNLNIFTIVNCEDFEIGSIFKAAIKMAISHYQQVLQDDLLVTNEGEQLKVDSSFVGVFGDEIDKSYENFVKVINEEKNLNNVMRLDRRSNDRNLENNIAYSKSMLLTKKLTKDLNTSQANLNSKKMKI